MKKIFALIAMMLSFQVLAEDPIYTGIFSNKAVEGYDTVAFFDLNPGDAPVKGKSQWVYEYQGADWYFSSQENLEKFKQNPDKYAPQYGGYCAWAVSAKNDFAPGDPEHWTTVKGKLYLNYNQDIQDRWNEDRTGHIQQADINWPQLTQ